jgi:hypothetical protein
MFVQNSKNFLDIKQFPHHAAGVSEPLLALQLMCSHFLLEKGAPQRNIYSFELSQRTVYETTVKAPIFRGFNSQEVNLEWALHCLNFFRYHLTDPSFLSMADAFDNLEHGERPSAWRSKLEADKELGQKWMGTYGEYWHHILCKVLA